MNGWNEAAPKLRRLRSAVWVREKVVSFAVVQCIFPMVSIFLKLTEPESQ